MSQRAFGISKGGGKLRFSPRRRPGVFRMHLNANLTLFPLTLQWSQNARENKTSAPFPAFPEWPIGES